MQWARIVSLCLLPFNSNWYSLLTNIGKLDKSQSETIKMNALLFVSSFEEFILEKNHFENIKKINSYFYR